MLNVTSEDLEILDELLRKKQIEKPDTKISIYKNRRGRYTGIYLWCKSNKGTCKIIPMFATTYNYELIDIKDLRINIKEN